MRSLATILASLACIATINAEAAAPTKSGNFLPYEAEPTISTGVDELWGSTTFSEEEIRQFAEHKEWVAKRSTEIEASKKPLTKEQKLLRTQRRLEASA